MWCGIKKKCIFAHLISDKRKRSFFSKKISRCSSVVEYILGKDGVMSSTLINGSFFFEMNIRIS